MNKDFKILFYDIETSPFLVYTFKIGNNISISHDNIKTGQKIDIICLSYKWAHEKRVKTLDWGFNKQNSTNLIHEFSEEIRKADIVIGHNGDKFDIKHINSQRLLQGKPPIAWPTSDDTLKQIRKHFNFASNRLDYLTKLLFKEGKHSMNLQTWINIVEKRDISSFKKMIRYNRKDVILLEKLFNKIRPFITLKANPGVDRADCKSCGSKNTVKYGSKRTKVGYHQVNRCNDCGHIFTSGRIK